MTTLNLFYTPKLLKLTCFYLKSYIFKHFQTKQYLKKAKNYHFLLIFNPKTGKINVLLLEKLHF